jgi:cytochrome P450
LAAEVAPVIPVDVVVALLGLPPEDAPFLQRVTREALSAEPSVQAAAHQDLLLYAYDVVDGAGDDGLFRRIRRALDEAPSAWEGLTPDELEDVVALNVYNVISAGSDTTRLAASGAALALAEHPAEWERLRGDPSLVPRAVEEVLRWTSPALHFLRTATREVVIGSTTVAAGEQVVIWNPSVNRDETVFEEPDAFHVGRAPNRHLAFGAGEHFCIGARLARLELRVLLEELAAAARSLSVSGEVRRLRSLLLQGVDELPLELA